MFAGVFRLMVLLVCVDFGRTLVSGWGEECNDTAECSDHRYVCKYDSNNIGRCFCDRFHEWGGPKAGCLQIYNYSTILNMSVVENKIREMIEAENDRIFKAAAVGGLFIIGTVIISFLVVTTFCLVIRKKDYTLKMSVETLAKQKRKGNMVPSCSVNV